MRIFEILMDASWELVKLSSPPRCTMSLSRAAAEASPLVEEIVSGAMGCAADNVPAALRDSGPDLADVAVLLLDDSASALRDLLDGSVSDLGGIPDAELLAGCAAASSVIHAYYRGLPRLAE